MSNEASKAEKEPRRGDLGDLVLRLGPSKTIDTDELNSLAECITKIQNCLEYYSNLQVRSRIGFQQSDFSFI